MNEEMAFSNSFSRLCIIELTSYSRISPDTARIASI